MYYNIPNANSRFQFSVSFCIRNLKAFIFSLMIFFVMAGYNKSYAQKKPNILWLVLEDTSPNFIGCYGNAYARTPAIDSLANMGIRFTNAFSTGTVCSPSRSCLITGVKTYELGTGNHRSSYQIPDSIHGFPYFLKQAGYYTSNNAKTDYNSVNEKRIIKESWNESSVNAGWWKRKPGQPFFAVFNFMESHESKTANLPYQQYQQLILQKLPQNKIADSSKLPLPPFLKDSPEMRKQYARIYNSVSLADIKLGMVLQRLKNERLLDSTIIFVYADHGEAMPRGKTNGIDLGYRVPLIVYVPPMYQSLSPWGINKKVVNELVCFEDFAPTMIRLANGNAPAYLKGSVFMGNERSKPVKQLFLSQDRSDESADLVRTVTDGRYLYSRNFMNFMPEMRFLKYHTDAEIDSIIRKDEQAKRLNKTQRIGLQPRPAEYLFDVEKDEWEIHNLSGKAKYQKILRQMRLKADSSILAALDVHFLPEYEMSQVDKSMPLYNFRKNPHRYPLLEIYAAAKLSGFQGKSIEAKQVLFLADTNSVVRFWASMGLRCQKEIGKKALIALTKAMDDPYPPVQIIAAAVCYDNSKDKLAKQKLIQYINSPNSLLRVAALQQINYMKHGKDFLDAVNQLKITKGVDGSGANTRDILIYKFKELPLNHF